MTALIVAPSTQCAPPPAHAAICDQFPRHLTQEKVEDFANTVKDAFPARYRAQLDRVAVHIRPNDELDLYASEVGGRHQLEISAGYLRNLCVLMTSALPLGDGVPPVDDELDDFARAPCPKEESRLRCLIAFLDKRNRERESSAAVAATLRSQGPTIRAALETAFLYGIAHEYGHVVAGLDPGSASNRPDYDPEFAADLAGLYAITSGRIPPVADGLLFSGLRVVALAGLTDERSDTAHEPLTCRAQRTNIIRKNLLPSLVKIYGWLNYGEKFDFFGKDATRGRIVEFAFPDAGATKCQAVPPALAAIADDLRLLGDTVGAFPGPEQATPAQVERLASLTIKTGFGRSLHSQLVLEARLARPEIWSKRELPGGWAAMAGLLDLILNDPGSLDMASGDYHLLLVTSATARFSSASRGSSFREAAARLDSDLRAASAYGKPEANGLLMESISSIANGRCNEGVHRIAELADLMDRIGREGGRPSDGPQVKPPTLPLYITDSIQPARDVVARGTVLPPRICEAMRDEIAAPYKQAFGLAD